MFKLFLYAERQWFSTVEIYGTRGFTWKNIQKIQGEIDSNLRYWKFPVTWSLSFDNEDVTKEFIAQRDEMCKK